MDFLEVSKDGKPKYPLLRCPNCGYQYRPTMHGWAFRTDKNTRCIGKDVPPATAHTYNHPFEVVEESEQ